MNLSDKEKQAVITVLKLYRSWMYQTVKDQNDLEKHSKAHLVSSLTTITSAQKKIEASLLSLDDIVADMGVDSSPGVKTKNISSAKILIADDDGISLELIYTLLEDIGFSHIEKAKNGQQAFDKISEAQGSFDLIICDWRMSEKTGLEVHSEASSQSLLNDTTFILLTAIDDEVLESRARKQGINDYITKPVDIDAFEEKMKVLFDN
ncbi:MAG: PleD family two-component response regulator [Lentisphaeria bacterium]|jgi:PleD family two-component response regulator